MEREREKNPKVLKTTSFIPLHILSLLNIFRFIYSVCRSTFSDSSFFRIPFILNLHSEMSTFICDKFVPCVFVWFFHLLYSTFLSSAHWIFRMVSCINMRAERFRLILNENITASIYNWWWSSAIRSQRANSFHLHCGPSKREQNDF